MQRRNENYFFYMLKGIACFLVITVHYPMQGKYGEMIRIFARCAVPMFFIISGRYMYGTGRADTPGMRKKLIRRFVRLSLITLGVLMVYTLYSFVFYRAQGMSVQEWIHMKYQKSQWLFLLMMNSGQIVWDYSYVYDFMWYLFATLWVLLFMIVTLKWSAEIKMAICIALMSMLYVCQYMHYSGTLSMIHLFCGDMWFYRNWLFTGIPFTLVGVWIGEMDVNKAPKPLVWWTLAACGVYLAVREAIHFETRELSIGIGMLTIALSVLAEYYPRFGSRLLAFVGKHLSATIYYWHVMIGAALGLVLDDSSAVFSILVMGCSLLLSLIVYGMKKAILHKRRKCVA